MEMLLALLKLALFWFGGAKAVEKTLENFVMNQPWMPQGLKKYVVPLGSLITSVIVSVHGGVPLPEAILSGITFAGTVDFVHDHPTLTAADWPLPPPPAAADGLPKLN